MGGSALRSNARWVHDFERIFNASPSPQLLLSPDFTIVGVNAAYLTATMTRREEIMGRGMFDIFPDNPDDPQASGVGNLRTSLMRVLATGQPDTMPVQKYDIRRPPAAGGGFEERWWSPINVPVLDGQDHISCIIHRVEDVTAYIRLGREATLSATERSGHPQVLEIVGRNWELHEALRALALSNEQLRLALKAGHAGTFDWDSETGYCRWSAESLALYGLDAFGGRYEDWLERVLPEDRDVADVAARRALTYGRVELDFRICRHSDGAVRWMHVRAEVSFDEARKPRRVVGIQMDVTERRQAEEEIRRQAALLEMAPDPIFVWHEGDGICFWNRACQEIYGFSPEEVIGQSPHTLLKTEFPVSLDAFKAELDHAGRWAGELRHTTQDGRRLVTESWVRRLVFNGQPLFLEATRDITERKVAQAENEESRLRLAAILNSLTEGVVVADLDGNILDMNPVALKLHGFQDVSEAKRRLPQFIDQFELRSLEGTVLPLETWPLARVLRGESFVDHELEVIRKDLDQAHILAYNGTPVIDNEGKVILAVLTLRDIGQRKRAELALRDSEHRLDLALKASGTAVWELDVATGQVISGNDLLFTMLGYSPWEIDTLTEWLALIHPDDQAPVSRLIEDLISGKRESYLAELRQRTKDGHWRWIRCQALAPERDAQGRAIRLLGAHTDITERTVAEAEIRQLNAKLEERIQARTADLERLNEALLHSNVELQHFAHATAHDLQTPLRSIAGFAQLLKQKIAGHGDPELSLWADLVVDNTLRLQALIEGLLSYSGLDTQGLPFEEVDMEQLLGEALDMLKGLISRTGTEVTQKPLPRVRAERIQIAQVLQNLIENGIKYNASKPPKVAIAAELHGERWVFAVTDNGIGIDPRHHEQIFELFRRLHTYHQVPGTGIGLALCRRIVERHGGHIWVESRPGNGSTFYFSLPVVRPNPVQ